MKKDGIHAYAGKILRVNLSNGYISTSPIENYAKEWLGASGIGAYILYKEVKPWVTPYSPANRLVFGAGTLCGTLATGASRMSGESINPLTGGFGSSNCDSHFGNELKYAGYDTIIIQGKANRPVYLWINDDNIEIREASHLWGKTTRETFNAIRLENQDDRIHTLSIGPAGENVVRAACIIQDTGRAMGRCGLGGVMGSKNMKAIAVTGSGEIKIADPGRFMKAVDAARSMYDKSSIATMLQRIGTPSALPKKQEVCGVPYKNFQFLTIPENMLRSLDQEELQKKCKVRNLGYPGCPIACGRYFRIDSGPYAGLEAEGFQFEALVDLTTKLGLGDPTFTIKANTYCNEMGMDIDLAGGVIGWAFECYEKGILKRSDVDGLKLEWGNTEVILELIRKIAYREGFGDVLAEGSAKAADILGRNSSYYAMHMKGQDLYESIRGAVGWGLGCTTSTRGGGHTTGAPACENSFNLDQEQAKRIYGITTANDALSYQGKAELVEFFEELHRVNNCLGICHFNTVWADVWLPGFPEMAEFYSAATGWETSEEELKRMAKRQLNIEKAFNLLRTSLDRKDDYPTPRDMNEPIPSGKVADWKIEKKNWDTLLDEYYDVHGWDKTTSFPTRKCLEDLGLKWVADDLARVGKLGKERL
ncbi:aldehyde ferredoxin oxidoreductase family protein [Chloroflexota bacterium]